MGRFAYVPKKRRVSVALNVRLGSLPTFGSTEFLRTQSVVTFHTHTHTQLLGRNDLEVHHKTIVLYSRHNTLFGKQMKNFINPLSGKKNEFLYRWDTWSNSYHPEGSVCPSDSQPAVISTPKQGIAFT